MHRNSKLNVCFFFLFFFLNKLREAFEENFIRTIAPFISAQWVA